MTVLSGLDFFFGVRRRMAAGAALAARAAESLGAPGVEPLLERRLARGGRARVDLRAQL